MSVSVHIKKDFGSFQLDVDFDIEKETLALLGASGCGKSMTLRCIAGIVKPDRGEIIVDGVPLFNSERHINLSPQERRVGLLFQNYALFPNMSLLENIRAGANRDKDRRRAEKRVQDIIEAFDLIRMMNLKPGQLSGGQQQRTALARILVSQPNLLMLDEPFSALDAHLRFRLEQEVLDIIRSFEGNVILVSHNRDEVFHICDKIAVMNDGHIEACDEKHRLFQKPGTLQCAILTGVRNHSRIVPRGEGHIFAVDWGIELPLSPMNNAHYTGIRSDDIQLCDGAQSIRCKLVREMENPTSFTILVKPEKENNITPLCIAVEKSRWQALHAESVNVFLPPEKILLLE